VLSRKAKLVFASFLAGLIGATVVLAERVPLWNDELFTYYVSDLGGPREIWSELETGVEQTPFSFYLLTHEVMRVLGDAPLAMRLPEVLGFALMAACLFLLVARRSSPLYGFVAVLLTVASTAYDHAYEARAYALVLGFSGAALLCWQVATEGGPRRRLAAVGLWFSLALAVGSHYYAVLLLIPLFAGEAARSLRGRSIDWPVIGAFSGALVPLLVFAPLIQAAQEYSTTFWARPTWIASVRFHLNLLSERWLWVLVAVVLLAGVFAARRAGSAARRLPPPKHELVALATVALLPAFGVLVGQTITGAFTGRYTLAAVIGVAALVALAASWVDREVPLAGISLLVLFALVAGVRYVDRHSAATREADVQAQAIELLERYDDGSLPLAVANPHEFFVLSHRVAQDGGPRLVYLASARLSLAYLGTDAIDLGVVGMKRIAPLHVEPFRSFVAETPRFLLYGSRGTWTWVSDALRSDGAHLRVVARNAIDGEALFEVAAD
jgi:hypothetical protein